MFFLRRKRIHVQAVLQFEVAECGAASLASVLAFYGKYLKLSDVRKACDINRDGSSLKDIYKAAISYSLEPTFVQWKTEEIIQNNQYPLICFWQGNHFLVLESIINNDVFLADPARGNIKITIDEFNESYSNAGLIIKPGKDFEKEASKKSVLWGLLKQLTRYKSAFIELLIASTALAALPVFSAGLTSVFINNVLQNTDINLAIPIVWLLLIITILLITAQLIKSLIMRRIEFSLSKKLAANLFTSLFKASYLFHSSRSSGELASRMILGMTIVQSLMTGIVSFTIKLWTGLIVLIFAILLSGWLSLVSLIIIILNTVANSILTTIRYEANRKLAISEGELQGTSLYNVNNIESIKASGIEYEVLDKWQEAFNKLVNENQILGSQLSATSVLSSTSQFILSFLIILVGGLLIFSGRTTLGTLVAFQFILPQISAPIGMFPSVSIVFQRLIGDLARLEDLEEAETDPLVVSLEQDQTDKDTNIRPMSGSIKIQNLVYGFKRSDEPIFNNLNLSISPGSHLTIVGSSGSGKTTLMKLLAGFYIPWAGKILFDKLSWSPENSLYIRSQTAYVPQQVFVFNASIFDNLTLFKPGFKQHQIEEAVRDASLSEVILNHPEAYKRHLKDNGRDLSGGERQRLEIARALLLNPTIMLLDEATSALDNQTQANVMKALKKRNTTIVSIAHRINVACDSDYVIVLNNGKITEQGPPKELIAQKGEFYTLLIDESVDSYAQIP